MNMGENEIRRDYHLAKDKRDQVKVLAQRNCVSPREMAQWLKDHGEEVDKRFFSKAPAKVTDPTEPKPAKLTRDELDEKDRQMAKADKGKPRLSLVPLKIWEAAAHVREYGVRKYKDPDNWKKVEPERYVEALLRHVRAFADDPLGLDEESHLPHLWHIACNCAFLIAMTWSEMWERMDNA